jgi:hypothetical protein
MKNITIIALAAITLFLMRSTLHADEINYTVVESVKHYQKEYSSLKLCIVISEANRNEKDLIKLGKKLSKDYKNEERVFIGIYSSKEAYDIMKGKDESWLVNDAKKREFYWWHHLGSYAKYPKGKNVPADVNKIIFRLEGEKGDHKHVDL